MGYCLKKYNQAKCNYVIYDKRPMVIIGAFENWKPELKNSVVFIQVIFDHKNLESFFFHQEAK